MRKRSFLGDYLAWIGFELLFVPAIIKSSGYFITYLSIAMILVGSILTIRAKKQSYPLLLTLFLGVLPGILIISVLSKDKTPASNPK